MRDDLGLEALSAAMHGDAGVAVTQADRDAAANLMIDQKPLWNEFIDEIRSGENDTNAIVEAFARARIASTQAERERIAVLEEALRPFARFAELFDDDDDCGDCPDHYPIDRASDREQPTIGHCRAARAAIQGQGAEE